MNSFSIILISMLAALNAHALGPTRSDKPFDEVKKLAEQGAFDYIYELGCRYEKGEKGATQDFKEAVKWHCKNKPRLKGATNRSMHRLEKIAEADSEIKDSTDASEIYCEQKKEPKPSLEDYSPLKVSWCESSDKDTKDCKWRFTKWLDKYGQPLSGSAIAKLALADLPPMSKSRDWFLDLVWTWGLYEPSLSIYSHNKYQNGLIFEDEKQRPHFVMEIKTKYLKKIKDGNFSYNEPTDEGRWKLSLAVQNKDLRECLERGIKDHFKETTILFSENGFIDRKYGREINVLLIKDCFGK